MNRLTVSLVALAAVALSLGAGAQEKKKVVLIAGRVSHGFAQHEHVAGCKLLANWLNKSAPVEAVVVENGWPKDESVLNGAAAIVIFCDGGRGHVALSPPENLKKLDALNEKGVGIGFIHYGVEPAGADVKPNGRAEFLKWAGGYFETFYSVNPHWKGTFTQIGKHPVANGVKPFATQDEWYYHMRFRENMDGVTPILSAVPPDKTRQGKDGPHSGNPDVRAGVGKNQPETTVWVSDNKNGSRGFGCTGAHFHFNWGSDNFRKTILNAIVWIAKAEVPANGVECATPTVDELLQNVTKPLPKDFDKAKEQKKLEEMNQPVTAPAAAAATK